MRNVPFFVAAAALVAILQASPAHALATKTWVSGAGSDANPCTATQPCATFQHAHDVTAPGGEIGVLGPGNYGILVINRAIGVTNDGAGEGGQMSLGGALAINVSANVGDVVGIRGLVFDGAAQGGVAIGIYGGTAVHIQNCVIRNWEAALTGFGIQVQPSNPVKVVISDTVILNNGSGANSGGILIIPQFNGGDAEVVLDHVRLENNVVGLKLDTSFSNAAGSRVVLRNSTVVGNAGNGIQVAAGANSAAAFMVVERTTIASNAGTGIVATGPHATVLLSDSTIVRNGVGVSTANSGQLISYGNNRVNNNFGPDGAPTSSYGKF